MNWRCISDTQLEKLKIKNEAEAKAIRQMEALYQTLGL